MNSYDGIASGGKVEEERRNDQNTPGVPAKNIDYEHEVLGSLLLTDDFPSSMSTSIFNSEIDDMPHEQQVGRMQLHGDRQAPSNHIHTGKPILPLEFLSQNMSALQIYDVKYTD